MSNDYSMKLKLNENAQGGFFCGGGAFGALAMTLPM